MKQITEYNTETGDISRVLLIPEHHNPTPKEGFDYLEGNYSDDKYYIVDGVAVEKTVEQIKEEASSDSLLSDQEIADRDNRLIRDLMLKDSDWTQLPDAPVDQTAWATYRQALRDVPQQEGFPDEIIWPERPE